MRMRRLAQRLCATLLAFTIAFTPFVRFNPLAPVPAEASVADCYQAAIDGAKLLETAGERFSEFEFTKCMTKITSVDPIAIAVDGAMAIWGVALGAFHDTDSCNNALKTTLEQPIFEMFKALSKTTPGKLAVGFINLFLSLPGTAALITEGLSLVTPPIPAPDPPLHDPVTVDQLVAAGADILYAALQTGPAQLVFEYLTCGCQIAGTFIELGAAGLKLLDEAADCAKTAGEFIGALVRWPEALGEWLQCGLGVCLTPGTQMEETNEVLPMCTAGWSGTVPWSTFYGDDGKYYFAKDLQYKGQKNSKGMEGYWGYSASCDCPPDAYLMKNADESLTHCICNHPPDGYQAGGVCGPCPAGQCNVDGQCSNPPPGTPVIVNNKCEACPPGTQYDPVTKKCEPICKPGLVSVPGSKAKDSCEPCKADTKAVYSSTGGLVPGGECKTCDTGTSSTTGQTECKVLDCEHGLSTSGNSCAVQCTPFELGTGVGGAMMTSWLCEDSPVMNGFPVGAIHCPPGEFPDSTGHCLPYGKSKSKIPWWEWRMKVEEKYTVLEKVNLKVQEKEKGQGTTGVQVKAKTQDKGKEKTQGGVKTQAPVLELPGGGVGSQMPGSFSSPRTAPGGFKP